MGGTGMPKTSNMSGWMVRQQACVYSRSWRFIIVGGNWLSHDNSKGRGARHGGPLEWGKYPTPESAFQMLWFRDVLFLHQFQGWPSNSGWGLQENSKHRYEAPTGLSASSFGLWANCLWFLPWDQVLQYWDTSACYELLWGYLSYLGEVRPLLEKR